MSADNFRWICTDRRAEAEILKELVTAVTVMESHGEEDAGTSSEGL